LSQEFPTLSTCSNKYISFTFCGHETDFSFLDLVVLILAVGATFLRKGIMLISTALVDFVCRTAHLRMLIVPFCDRLLC